MAEFKMTYEKVATQRELAGVGCAVQDCEHDHSILVLLPPCHPDSALEAAYYKSDGTLYLRCFKCHKGLTLLQIAPGAPAEVS